MCSIFRSQLATNVWFWAGVALVVRLALLVVVLPQIDPERINFVDDLDYHRYGLAWAATGRYATAVNGQVVPVIERVPLYPAYLAAVYWLFGPRPEVAVIGQLLLQSLTCAMTVHLARKFAPGYVVWAGLIAALDPIAIIYVYLLFSETLFTFLLVGACCIILTWSDRLAAWFGTGIALGLATLTRPNALVIMPALLLLGLGHGGRQWLSRNLLAIAGLVLVMSPWLIRNQRLTGQMVLTNWDSTYVKWAAPGGFRHTSEEEARIDQYFLHLGKGLLINHSPTGGKILARLVGLPIQELPTGVGHSFQPIVGPIVWKVLRQKSAFEWGFVSYSTIWICATFTSVLLGFRQVLRRFDGPLWFLVAVPLLLVVSVALRGEARYRIPADALYAVVGAIGGGVIVSAWQIRRRHRSIRSPIVAPEAH